MGDASLLLVFSWQPRKAKFDLAEVGLRVSVEMSAKRNEDQWSER